MFERLKPEAVEAAAKRIARHIKRTRLVRSDPLSRLAGGDVYLKLENEQVTGSFKPRGAFNALATLTPEQQQRGVVASSAGNHGLGVAAAAKALGLEAKVYVPRNAPEVKKSGIRALGAELDDGQPDYDAAMDAAKAFGKETGRAYINPCLGDELLAGQGTVALEIVDELPTLRSLVVNVGGGGLLGGCASWLRRKRPDVRIYGAQSVNTAAMSKSLAAKKVVPIDPAETLADGLAGLIDEDAFDIGVHALDRIATVTEEEIAAAIRWLAEHHDAKVEGAGACGVAAVMTGKLEPETPCAIVLSGANIDEAKWRKILG